MGSRVPRSESIQRDAASGWGIQPPQVHLVLEGDPPPMWTPLKGALLSFDPLAGGAAAASRSSAVRRALVTFLEDPSSGRGARVWGLFILGLICLSTLLVLVESLPGPTIASRSASSFWSVAEAVSIALLTFEVVARIVAYGGVVPFFVVQPLMNFVDVVSIAPFYLELVLGAAGGDIASAPGLQILRVLRLARVFRLFRGSRDSLGLLLATMQRSAQPLGMLCFLVITGAVLFASVLYYCERGEYSEELGAWRRWAGHRCPVSGDSLWSSTHPPPGGEGSEAWFSSADQLARLHPGCMPYVSPGDARAPLRLGGLAPDPVPPLSPWTGLAVWCDSLYRHSRHSLAQPEALFGPCRPIWELSPFPSIPLSLWFTLVTMVTVGYGEITPVTAAGRTVAAVAMIFGILALAMPISVILANFTAVYQETRVVKALAERAKRAARRRETRSEQRREQERRWRRRRDALRLATDDEGGVSTASPPGGDRSGGRRGSLGSAGGGGRRAGLASLVGGLLPRRLSRPGGASPRAGRGARGPPSPSAGWDGQGRPPPLVEVSESSLGVTASFLATRHGRGGPGLRPASATAADPDAGSAAAAAAAAGRQAGPAAARAGGVPPPDPHREIERSRGSVSTVRQAKRHAPFVVSPRAPGRGGGGLAEILRRMSSGRGGRAGGGATPSLPPGDHAPASATGSARERVRSRRGSAGAPGPLGLRARSTLAPRPSPGSMTGGAPGRGAASAAGSGATGASGQTSGTADTAGASGLASANPRGLGGGFGSPLSPDAGADRRAVATPSGGRRVRLVESQPLAGTASPESAPRSPGPAYP